MTGYMLLGNKTMGKTTWCYDLLKIIVGRCAHQRNLSFICSTDPHCGLDNSPRRMDLAIMQLTATKHFKPWDMRSKSKGVHGVMGCPSKFTNQPPCVPQFSALDVSLLGPLTNLNCQVHRKRLSTRHGNTAGAMLGFQGRAIKLCGFFLHPV